jgi:hypothetical protein
VFEDWFQETGIASLSQILDFLESGQETCASGALGF